MIFCSSNSLLSLFNIIFKHIRQHNDIDAQLLLCLFRARLRAGDPFNKANVGGNTCGSSPSHRVQALVIEFNNAQRPHVRRS